MIKDSFCCSNCFNNQYIKNFIEEHAEEEGNCPYCRSTNVQMISLETLGKYLRDCIEKAYESCDDGTGAMYDSEEKKYVGPDGEEATTYSIRVILMDEEMIFNDDTITTTLLDDLFENLYSYREIQKGAEDPFDDIDSPMWVIRDDLYGDEQTRVFHAWESFKHMIKHYSRFFEPQGCNLREDYLGRMDPYIYEFITDVPSGTSFYRARKTDKNLLPIKRIEPCSQMGPPPAIYAKTNRMSPAGIPYLYLASDQETTLKECRIDSGEEAIIAEFISQTKLQILDLSTNKYFAPDSIFDPEYDHDNTWMNSFWRSFVKEISEPVSEDKEDHSYEYAATQLVAEYYRTKGYDGICFKSSVGPGKNYVFFMGPDPEYTTNAYPYPFNGEYYFDNLPILDVFTDVFRINTIYHVDGKLNIINTRKI